MNPFHTLATTDSVPAGRAAGRAERFRNSGRTVGRIRTGPNPFDAPKRRNNDGMCHVAPRVTWHVPRAAA